MNRQLRRAQEKQDKKQDKDKAKRRQDRRNRVQRLRAARARPRARTERSRDTAEASEKGGKPVATAGNSGRGGRGREPGRFSGAFALATVFFITLQGAYPDPDRTAINSLISAGFYLMLGYFGVLWLLRRGTERAFIFTIVGGVILAITTTVAAILQGRDLDPLLLALVLPAVIAGSYLGRLVYIHTPR